MQQTLISFPDKIVFGNNAVWPHKQIGIISSFFEYLNKTPCVTEGVKVNCRCGLCAEFIKEISVAALYLTKKSLGRGHKAIGLKIPAAHNAPFTEANKPLYSFKKLGLVELNVFV